MKRALLLIFVALAGCGPQGEYRDLGFDLAISRALSDTVSSLQISLVSRGSSLDCNIVQTNCLNAQIKTDQLVKVQDENGKEHLAITVPLNVKATGTGMSAQDVALRGIPPGKDFAVVIEALSKDAVPKLVGSSCNYVKEISSGTNGSVIAATIVPKMTPVVCDPRFEK